MGPARIRLLGAWSAGGVFTLCIDSINHYCGRKPHYSPVDYGLPIMVGVLVVVIVTAAYEWFRAGSVSE